jgi:adenosine deaminase CECR1
MADHKNCGKDMKQCIQAKKLYPALLSGYDLVGPEDHGRTLHSLTPELLWFRKQCALEGVNIPFFFHAGECLGDGDSTDHNLFDAILFKTRRIGHGFSLYKHPHLIDLVKKRQILVESCPISNEVLRYSASIMSHPIPALLARGVPVALSNDDPSMMGQEGAVLTPDFWQALQGWDNLGLAGLVGIHSLYLVHTY